MLEEKRCKRIRDFILVSGRVFRFFRDSSLNNEGTGVTKHIHEENMRAIFKGKKKLTKREIAQLFVTERGISKKAPYGVIARMLMHNKPPRLIKRGDYYYFIDDEQHILEQSKEHMDRLVTMLTDSLGGSDPDAGGINAELAEVAIGGLANLIEEKKVTGHPLASALVETLFSDLPAELRTRAAELLRTLHANTAGSKDKGALNVLTNAAKERDKDSAKGLVTMAQDGSVEGDVRTQVIRLLGEMDKIAVETKPVLELIRTADERDYPRIRDGLTFFVISRYNRNMTEVRDFLLDLVKSDSPAVRSRGQRFLKVLPEIVKGERIPEGWPNVGIPDTSRGK